MKHKVDLDVDSAITTSTNQKHTHSMHAIILNLDLATHWNTHDSQGSHRGVVVGISSDERTDGSQEELQGKGGEGVFFV
jgi:hypothetical protein